jgi:hypothetical protein
MSKKLFAKNQCWIYTFLDLPDPDSDPLVRDTHLDPDPSIILQK